MAKVICKLPNASAVISGVKFVTCKGGMISEEIADDVAARFARIRGYALADKKGQPVGDDASKGDSGGAPGVSATTGGTDPAGAAKTE